MRRGSRKGDKVTLVLHNRYHTANLLLGIVCDGCVVSPINQRFRFTSAAKPAPTEQSQASLNNIQSVP
jgi:acyl-coenzyme A synthetase/AMP-(fatty) acid ligase